LIKEEEPPRLSRRWSSSGAALATLSQQRCTEPAKLTKLLRGELDWGACAFLVVRRTALKDKPLRKEFEGCPDYAEKVRYPRRKALRGI
jgi:hypothetical protein